MKLRQMITAFAVLALAIFVIPAYVDASTDLDAMLEGNVITLTKNVTLTEKYVIPEGTTRTIDLNGYTLTGPSDNYTIENKGTLTIVDNGATKGKIVGVAPSSSNIRNLGTLKVDGVTIESTFISIKNDSEGEFYGNLTVENSTITSNYQGTDTGAIMNWASATINNSTISNSGVAIYSTSGGDSEDNLKNSTITINNSSLTGSKYALYSRRDNTVPNTTSTQKVTVNGGTISGRFSAASNGGSDAAITGNVKVDNTTKYTLSDVLGRASSGANVTLTTDLTNENITVPEGVTLTIAKGATYRVSSSRRLTVEGDLVIEGTIDAAALVEDTNIYFGTLANAVKLIGDGHNVVVMKDVTENTITPYANKDITIDLNGNSVTANVTNVAGTTLTLKDASLDGTGSLEGVITNNGTLIIESGKYSSLPTTDAAATTTINGGTYPIAYKDQVIITEDQEIVENADGTFTVRYKKADYSEVDKAIAKAESLNKADYKDFSLVEAAINNVVRDKDITEQAIVDAYAQAIYDAIASLELKEEATNPNTSDNIMMYVVTATVATIGMGGTIISRRRHA